MSDGTDIDALRRYALELEHQLEHANLTIARLEATLADERDERAVLEQGQDDHLSTLEDAYKAELELRRFEVALWRSDDHPRLLQFFAARLAKIDSSLASCEACKPWSELTRETMSAHVDRLRAERLEIAAVHVRLRRS